jgi:hypothetical protein
MTAQSSNDYERGIAIQIADEVENLTDSDVDEWLAGVLETEIRGVRRGGEWVLSSVDALVMHGGPTARVSWIGTEILIIEVHSASDTYTTHAESATLAEAFAELAGMELNRQ